MDYLVGIDVATTGTKTIIIDPSGTIVGEGFKGYPTSTPQPGWVEQNPEDWWKATIASIKDALAAANVPAKQIKGLGLSGQMHGATFVDKQGNPLRPCLIWADARTGPQCERINKIFGPDKFIELTCNPPLASFTATKIVWVQENEPEVFKKTRKVLLPKDYVRYKLTGKYATEVSDASGTVLLDVRNRKWSDEVLRGLSIPSEMMPEVFESYVPSAHVSAEAAKATGLAEGTPVVGGGGDVEAGAVGSGAVKSGVVTIIMGSGGVVFAATDDVVMDKQHAMQSFCHAVPNMWHIMGVMLSCSFSLRYYKETFAQAETAEAEATGTDVYEILNRQARNAPPGSEGLMFLPYLNGERTPHKDSYAKGCFFGMTLRHNKEHYVRSVMEGVAYGLRDSIELARQCGVNVSQVRAVGGGAKSPLWRQILADVFNCEVVTINVTEASAHGVAVLAGVGTGVYTSVQEGCDRTIKVTSSTTPIPANVPVYNGFYSIFRQLYPALKKPFREVSDHVARL